MNAAYDCGFEHVYTKLSTFSIFYYILIMINIKGVTNASHLLKIILVNHMTYITCEIV